MPVADSCVSMGEKYAREFNSLNGRRVLIVDPDVSLASFLRNELQEASFSVEVVHDGEAALAAIQEQRLYDLLITGLNLPQLDGIALIDANLWREPFAPGDSPMMFVSFGTLHDPTYDRVPRSRHTADLIVMTAADAFVKWMGKRDAAADREYRQEKAVLEEKLLAQFARYFRSLHRSSPITSCRRL